MRNLAFSEELDPLYIFLKSLILQTSASYNEHKVPETDSILHSRKEKKNMNNI